MKNLVIIFLLLFVIKGRSQTIQYLGSPTTQIYVRGQIRIDTVIYFPLRDTTFTPSQIGAFVVKSTVPYLWTGTKWLAVATGSPTWGQIQGTLSDQTDLQSALNAKQNTLTAGYGIKIATNTILFDSANVRKVDTIYRQNDSTLIFTINGLSRTVLLRGTAAGGITSLVLNVPSSIYATPVTFNNTAGAWSGTLALSNQSANTIFAGPAIGSPGSPSFRTMQVADLPPSIPNAYLQNSSINLSLGSAGTSPAWGSSAASLGGTATLNIPTVNGTNTGIVTPSLYGIWNDKIDSTHFSGDSVFDYSNGVATFRYIIAPVIPAPPLDSVLKAGNHTKRDIIFDTAIKATSQGYTFRPITMGWRSDDTTATIGYYPITFTPYDSQRGNFVFNWGSAANINDPATGRDEALGWGYNIDNSMPTDAHAKWQIESNWTQSGINQMETYYEIQLKNGAVIRPLFITSSKTDTVGQITTEATVYSFEEPEARFPLLGMTKQSATFEVVPQGTFAIRDSSTVPNTVGVQLGNNGPVWTATGPGSVISQSFNNAVSVHNTTNPAAGGSMEVQLYSGTPYGYSAYTSGTLAGSVYPIYFNPAAVTVDSRIYNSNTASNADNVFRISSAGRNSIYGLYDAGLGNGFTQEFHGNAGDKHTVFNYNGTTQLDFDNASLKLIVHDSLQLANVPSGSTTDSLLVIGNGVVHSITAPLTGSATLDFPSTAAGTSSDLTITVTGASDGDVVSIGVPNAAISANTCYTAWVSASNTVTVRFNNYSVGAVDPSSGTFKTKVTK